MREIKILTLGKLLPGMTCLLAIMMALGLSNQLIAQTHTNVYDMSYDVKGYSTEMCTDYNTNSGETVKAGTIYNYSGTGNHAVHFLNVADDGTVNNSVFFEDPQYVELRVVDIVGDENGGWNAPPGTATYYITCLGRTANANDQILIIPVDNSGTQVGPARSVFLGVGTTPDNDQNIYPLHSIYHQGNSALYICGYYTTNQNGANGTSIRGTGEPDYTSDKFAFIYGVQFNGTTWTTVNVLGFGTQTAMAWTGASTTPTNDYDIAMRMVEDNAGDIFITGSVNDVKYNSSLLKEVWHSATMNVNIAPSLMPATFSANHISSGSEVDYYGDEYGVGMVEAPNNEKYIISNQFYHGNAGATGFDPNPSFYMATWVDNTYTPDFTNNTRLRFNGYDYAWALQTLEGPASTLSGTYGARLIVAGTQVNEWCGNPYNDDDVRTFLHDWDLAYNNTTKVFGFTFNRYANYLTQSGTGVRNTDPNSYWDLGGGISNIAWNPTFAARKDNTEDIYFAAPTWRPGTPDYLNMKNVRVDGLTGTNYLTEGNCPSSYNYIDNPGSDCFGMTAYVNEQPYALGYLTVSIPNDFDYPGLGYNTTSVVDMTTGTVSVTEDACTSTNPAYKQPNNIVEEIKNRATSVFPNPATNQIFVELSGNIADDAKVEVRLTNIYGQQVNVLYTGYAQELSKNKELSLNNVASGIYLVQVIANGEQVLAEKLTVQH